MKIKEIIKIIEKDGWFQVAQVGSHKQYKHANKKGKVTIPFHQGKDIPIGTLKSILKQAGLK
ncbi:MAG: type II toxin-antitoxin system HicA family toxin [Chitinophagaceae bacterium]|jgi:predicted RNA binding protein YcfA (HicA-like mRNA interferase family)|nr:type II toxin-antitoxin system HicA family toxin [Chitinophagaceae bacterium]